MVRGVTAIAQCDQVGGVIDPTGGTGNQMMNVGFALGACFAASSANVRIASENDSANGAPLFKLRLGRWKRHSVHWGIHGQWSEGAGGIRRTYNGCGNALP